MNLRTFFTDPAIQLPIVRNSNDFQGFVDGLLDTYLAKISELTAPAEIVALIREQQPAIAAFCVAGKAVVKAALAGDLQGAYSSFEQGIKNLEPHLLKQELANYSSEALGFCYRVRVHRGESLDREGLFHIPFENRHLVATQRYSVPGLPCLYLGGSLYTCWAEMGRPPFHELYAAAFWLKPEQTVKLLDFTNRPARLLLFLNAEGDAEPLRRDFLTTHVILWPLMALCSIPVLHRSAPFKPEYILPQIVLQWVSKNHKFDGVCYFSTHVAAVTRLPLPPCNIIFPARGFKARGRCEWLRERFKMTEPHPWELLRAVKIEEGGGYFPPPSFQFEFVKGKPEMYYKTEFGLVQMRLNKLAYDIARRNADGELDLGTVAE
ncbi:RES domain-containing protein [Gemmata sp. JC717]|uniref:RES domain-containing protein n=1 Tax=Gemmata algarum TaxID=2975278 RepID=UPI0021BB326B|nr:RES domain-containing protein [Gemmata algarum]MDY3553748.1 RES domain-containing protein [Gemmata algarum]